jgi:peroxiredoxin
MVKRIRRHFAGHIRWISLILVLPWLASCRGLSLSEAWNVKEGDSAPDFTLVDTAGEKRSLSEFKDRVVLVSFFATWCPPCNAELPELEKLWSKHKDAGLTVIAVSQGESASDVAPFVQNKALTFPVLIDESQEVGAVYGGGGLPRTAVIDRSGKVRLLQVGYGEGMLPALEALIVELLREEPVKT